MLRTVIIDLPFSFVDDDVMIASDPSKYRKRDNTVKHRFETDDKYKYACMDLLLRIFNMFKEQFLNGTFLQNQGTPQKVRESITSYFGQFDTTSGVNTWLGDTVEETELGVDHRPLDVGTLFNNFKSETTAKMSKADFVDKVKAALGERSQDRNERATSRGVYKNGNFYFLQGYKLKEVLAPSTLGDMFGDVADGAVVPLAPQEEADGEEEEEDEEEAQA